MTIHDTMPITVSELCRVTGLSHWRASYCLNHKGPPHVGYLGAARIWPREQYEQLVTLLREHAQQSETRTSF